MFFNKISKNQLFCSVKQKIHYYVTGQKYEKFIRIIFFTTGKFNYSSPDFIVYQRRKHLCNPRKPKGTFSGYTKSKKSPLVLSFCKRYTSF